MRLFSIPKLALLPIFLGLCCVFSAGQQTNPVERQVSNPISDKQNVNPVAPEPTPVTRQRVVPGAPSADADDENLTVDSESNSAEGTAGNRIVTHTGNVDVRYGVYRLQADKVTVYEAENRVVAEGSVVFDQGEDQRITGTRAEWNYKTKLGYFVNSTGFTNQTNDGSVVYFTAERVERVSLDEIVITDAEVTACEDNIPKWSFTTDEARVKTNDRVKLKNPRFRVKNVPILALPYASIPIKKRDRASGFLTPTFGFSGRKGLRVSTAYYQTLGESADATARFDLFTARGVGFGVDVRTRANSRSFFDFGFYAVKDRIFGQKVSEEYPDEGGSVVYAQGVHYFSNGFTAAADVRLTSSLAFRQVFSDGIQQVISPIEVSQVFLNKSWDDYTFNALARTQVTSIPNVRVRTRNLPSVSFEKRPSLIPFFDNAYFSFKTSLDGVSRQEEVDDVSLYRQIAGGDPIVTPSLGLRFDVHPQVTLPFYTKYFNFTATAGFRATYYNNSLDGMRRVTGEGVLRKYGEFEFDVRPVALAKNYYRKNGSFGFRHTIEPFLTYRLVKGVNNFNRIIRFDYVDTLTDTSEIEYGVTSRIFTRRYTEAVTDEARRLQSEQPNGAKNPLSVQPYEIFTLTVRGKYFFDEDFGGALTPGRRNQIAPITALTFYTFGGVARRFSPLNIDATYRPQRTIFVNTKLDFTARGASLRAVSATVGYDTRLLKIFQTFYYTRAVDLLPELAQFENAAGKEPGTLRGSQWNPSFFAGDRDRGIYGGASLFFDFQNRRALDGAPLVSSQYTVGYAFDCCSVAVQAHTFNVGIRRENRFVFSFKLNGIGAFGTEQFGQGLR